MSQSHDRFAESDRLTRNATIRVAIRCENSEHDRRYSEAAKSAGYFVLEARPDTTDEISASKIDILICSAPFADNIAWEDLMKAAKPNFGTIAVTNLEDPRWIVKCIRAGAFNCHLESEEDRSLIEMIDECVTRNQTMRDGAEAKPAKSSSRLATRLKQAITDEIIDVHFQPIVDSDDFKTSRVEALARWSDGQLGFITPTEFIATAEEEGLVAELGELILKKSIIALDKARKHGHDLHYSINVSRRQFDDPDLVRKYTEIVRSNGEDPKNITIEVTETAKYENHDLAHSLMKDFIAEGFDLAVDDFGTGESSFIQISQVQYAELKVDRSLVSRINDEAGLSIILSIISMAKSLHMYLVAEGVEDLTTAELLRDLDVDFCQGYYFAKPMSIEDLIEFLNKCNRDRAIDSSRPSTPIEDGRN